MKKAYLLSIFIALLISCKKAELINPNKIIGWGDSLTAGIGGKTVTYPKRLSELTNYDVVNKGVSGETSTKIKVRMLSATNLHMYPTIIWAGRNNFVSSPKNVIGDIDSMVNILRHSHYLVLGIINGDTLKEFKNADYYKRIQAINDTLSARYGLHYLDIKPYLIAKADSNNTTDLRNIKNDVIPSTLRSDYLHLNDKGYSYVAEAIYTKFNILINLP